jgi:hypothetical protein
MLWTPFRIGDARDVPSQKQKQTHVPNFQLVVVLLQSRQAQMLQSPGGAGADTAKDLETQV